MAENETTDTLADDDETSSTSTETEVNSFVDENGVFKEGWIDNLVPEDFRDRPVFKMFTDIKGLMKQVGHQDLTISRQGKGIMKPSDKDPQAEWDVFYEAVGRPKTPDDYKVEVPKGLEEYYDNPLLGEAKTALHAAGLTQKQVDAVMALDVKRLQTGVEQLEAQKTAERAEAEKTLRTKWGDAYDERLHIANRMIAENVSEEDKPKLLEIIGDNPQVADFLANIGKKFMEGKGIVATDAQGSGKMTPDEARNRARELMATPGYADGTLSQAVRDRIGKEIAALYRMVEGGKA